MKENGFYLYQRTGIMINLSLKLPTRFEQVWRSMLITSLYEKRPFLQQWDSTKLVLIKEIDT